MFIIILPWEAKTTVFEFFFLSILIFGEKGVWDEYCYYYLLCVQSFCYFVKRSLDVCIHVCLKDIK